MIRSSRAATIGILVAALAIAVSWAIATRGSRRVPMTPEVAREMRAGVAFAAHIEKKLAVEPAESISIADAVAQNYLARLRLGLGSPFRLIDFALADRMLPDTTQHLLAYALLQRTLDGDTYHAPPAALTAAGNTLPELPVVLAARHVALIDSVVARASDPRGGELTVREAYRIAGAGGAVGRRGPWLGTQVAALARDRALARTDVLNLLATARRNHMDPLGLIPVWRLERRFAVERPVMEALQPEVERRALVQVSAVVQQLDSLAAAERRFARDSVPAERAENYGISADAARRLAWVASVRAAPPQAPITVAVTSTVRPARLTSAASIRDESARDALERFSERAVNEETLAAEYAVFLAGDAPRAAQPSLAVL